MKLKIFSAVLFLPVFLPTVAFAQSSKTLSGALDPIIQFLSKDLLYIVMSLALVAFFLGVALYIYRSSEKPDIEYAKGVLLWGVIGLAVMFSVGGIAVLLQKTLGIQENSSLPYINERDYQINTGYSSYPRYPQGQLREE